MAVRSWILVLAGHLAACGAAGGDPDGGVDGGPDPIAPAACLADPDCQRPILSAHRGLCGDEPENTIAAFKACAAAGVPMVEVDTRETADGQVVVMHDSDVDRTTDGEQRFPGRTDVALLSLAEFQSLVIDDPRCATDPDAAPERCRPPTFAELLAATGDDLLVFLDFKAGDPARQARVVVDAGAQARVALFDSDIARLRAWREVIPEAVVIPRGSTAADFEAMLVPENDDLDLRWVHGEGDLIPESVAVLGPAGIRFYCNAWDGDDNPEVWVGAAELLTDPDQIADYHQRGFDALDVMIEAGARGLGTNFGHVFATHLHPDGFGR